MRSCLVALGLVLVGVVTFAGSTSAAQPGADASCVSVIEDRSAHRQGASLVIERFAAAVVAGDCRAVAALDAQVRELDPAYYRCAFAGDATIAGCTSPPAASTRAPESPERVGFLIGADVEAARSGGRVVSFAASLRMGWQIQPWIAVIGLAGALLAVDPAPAGLFVEGGVRLSLDPLSVPVFVDARIGWVQVGTGCDYDEPCGSRTITVRRLGVGLELLNRRHFSLDIHLQRLSAPDERDYFGGVGFTSYL